MSNKNSIRNLLQAKGLLFPETEKEVEVFESLNPIYNETPSDWNSPEDIIKRGIQKLKNIKSESTEALDNEIEELRMVARKGNALPQHIIDKMKANHKKNDK
ncbi:hypothetical protein [Chryseobacterium gwangjuense]|uniref:hypothetical protein n=1 Tax=Chryseobacterium gwangjuense TaxID=1069980 RepID=UPI001E2ACB63|nr:hypothetical protein [Chryseobacterium gwangjuense]MCE3074829.1 hypothetical protein [Chryseobacterium gwangjuense]